MVQGEQRKSSTKKHSGDAKFPTTAFLFNSHTTDFSSPGYVSCHGKSTWPGRLQDRNILAKLLKPLQTVMVPPLPGPFPAVLLPACRQAVAVTLRAPGLAGLPGSDWVGVTLMKHSFILHACISLLSWPKSDQACKSWQRLRVANLRLAGP